MKVKHTHETEQTHDGEVIWTEEEELRRTTGSTSYEARRATNKKNRMRRATNKKSRMRRRTNKKNKMGRTNKKNKMKRTSETNKKNRMRRATNNKRQSVSTTMGFAPRVCPKGLWRRTNPGLVPWRLSMRIGLEGLP